MNEVENNKKLAMELVAAMNRADTQWFLDNYADDVQVWTMGNTLISGRYGKSEIAGFADGIYDAFPNGISFTILGITAEGDRVAVEAESLGEHASGQTYHNFYHFLFTIRDGKVASLKEYLDTELATDILCGGQRPEG